MKGDRSKAVTLWTFVVVALVMLSAPTLVVLGASFTAGNMITFPPEGLSLKWYAAIAGATDAVEKTYDAYEEAIVASSRAASSISPACSAWRIEVEDTFSGSCPSSTASTTSTSKPSAVRTRLKRPFCS